MDRRLTYDLVGNDRVSDTFKKVAASAETANRSMLDSNGRLQVAETKLNALRESGKATVVQLSAAEENVARLRRANEAATNKFADAQDRLSKTTRIASNDIGKLGDQASTSLPPIQPLAAGIALGFVAFAPALAAATGAVVTFGAAAGVSFAAFKGLQTEMSAGTPLGQALSAQVKGITSDFAVLETTAAKAAGPGVVSALTQVKNFLPTLNPLVQDLATHLGNAFNIGTGGLITGLKVMQPLMSDAGHYAEGLAQKVADFTASNGFKSFIDYARLELPIVGQMLGDVGKGVVELALSFRQSGEDVVKVLDGIGKAMSVAAKVKGFLDNFDMVKHYGAVGKVSSSYNDLTGSVGSFLATLTQQPTIAQQVAASMKQQADATALATGKMVAQNDAAGLLQAALDQLAGKQLSNAQAQNSFDSALVNMGDHITATGKKVHFTTTSINDMSSASVSLRGELIGQVTSAEKLAGTYGNLKNGSEAARQKLIQLRQNIIDNAVAHGVDRQAVTRYIDSVLKIPPKATTTGVLETTAAENKMAAYKAHLGGIPRTVSTNVYASTDGAHRAVESLLQYINGQVAYVQVQATGTPGAPGSAPSGGRKSFADGGFVSGPGSATSDSINARLSNGEFVMNAAATAAYRPMLENMNTRKFAAGGYVAPSGHATVNNIHITVNAGLGNGPDIGRQVLAAMERAVGQGATAHISRGIR